MSTRTRKEIVKTISGSSAINIDFGEGGLDEDGNAISAAEALKRMGVIFFVGFLGDTAGISTETLTLTATSAPLNNATAFDAADNPMPLLDRAGAAIVLDPANAVYGAWFDGPVTRITVTPSGAVTDTKLVVSWF